MFRLISLPQLFKASIVLSALLMLTACDNRNLPTEAPEWRSDSLPQFKPSSGPTTPPHSGALQNTGTARAEAPEWPLDNTPSLRSPIDNTATNKPAIQTAPPATLSTTTFDTTRFIGAYAGELPCADCEAIRTILMFSADSTYTLQEIYLKNGEHPQLPQQGKWTPSADGSFVELDSGKRQPGDAKVCFGIIDAQTIVKYDIACQPIALIAFDYTLKKAWD